MQPCDEKQTIEGKNAFNEIKWAQGYKRNLEIYVF